MTNTPDRAAVMIAHPLRADQGEYRVILYRSDDTAEISPRLSYDRALAFASDRGAEIQLDEHATREQNDQP